MAKYKPATAPYNFVSLPGRTLARYEKKEDLPKHNIIYKQESGRYSGVIVYTVKTKSPCMVSDGRSNGESAADHPCMFFKNAAGEYAIPGSTMRGLLYENVQILGLCNPKDNVYDARYLYRDWASLDARLKAHYKEEIDVRPEFGTPGKVKAGYIYQDRKDHYCIQPAKDIQGKTFYPVNEQKVRNTMGSSIPDHNYMYSAEFAEIDKRNYIEKNGLRGWFNLIKRYQNKDFKPYFRQVSFQTNSQNGVSGISGNGKALNFHGILLCSGFIQKKQAHYVIHDMDMEKAVIELPGNGESIRSYKEDLEKKKEKNSFYFLPEEVGIAHKKPIFYADGNERIYIGMTPYLRIMYGYSVHDGIPKQLDTDGFDYAEAMFGFTERGDLDFCYKSRICVLDAVCHEKAEEMETVKLALGEPKASCYPLYLRQPQADQGKLISYADDGFVIRGYKQYWLTDRVKAGDTAKDRVSTFIKPIRNAAFTGKIRYENLSRDELGLLVFALKISDKAYQNIGMGKPYGYGKVTIEDISVKAYNLEKLYGGLGLPQKCLEDLDADELIAAYKTYVQDRWRISIEDQTPVKEFLYMKTHVMRAEYTNYMTLQNQDSGFAKKLVLPNVLEYESVVRDAMLHPENYQYIENSGGRNSRQGGSGKQQSTWNQRENNYQKNKNQNRGNKTGGSRNQKGEKRNSSSSRWSDSGSINTMGDLFKNIKIQ